MLPDVVSKQSCTYEFYLPMNTLTGLYTEKWAMCFRKFDHSDTDTNVHLER